MTVFVIFSIINYSIYRTTRNGILSEAIERYHGMAEATNEQVSSALGAVEVALTNNIPIVEENLDEPDNLYGVVKRILELNPNIIGSAVAFGLAIAAFGVGDGVSASAGVSAGVEAAVGASVKHFGKVSFDTGHHCLRLGIAHANVVFNHVWIAVDIHQSQEDESFIINTIRLQAF